MSKQKQNGYGLEIAFLEALFVSLEEQKVKVKIIKDSSYDVLIKNQSNLSTQKNKENFDSCRKAVKEILQLEPRLTSSNKTIFLKVNSDIEGIKGDVRDLVAYTEDGWQIGFSCKYNNESAKHSRISPHLDFSRDWLNGKGCSGKYKSAISDIFQKLSPLVKQEWKGIGKIINKEKDVYSPLIQSFTQEMTEQLKQNSALTENLFSYILGRQDYYKIIKMKNKIIIKGFNLNNSLDKNITKISLPKKITNITQTKANTCIIDFDNLWSLSFRVHNASSRVENSMKFDVKIKSSPVIFEKVLK